MSSSTAVHVRVPGDKSVSIRALLLSLVADSACVVRRVPDGQITSHTLDALRALGATVHVDEPAPDGDGLTVRVEPPTRLRTGAIIDCGGSATLARLLMGLLAGAGVEATLTGSVMLSRRPMERVAAPLARLFGRAVVATTNGRLPVRIIPGPAPVDDAVIEPGDSAQVRAAVMFAALAAQTPLTVWSAAPGRRHTEQLLRRFGSHIVEDDPDGRGRARRTRLRPAPVRSFDLTLPGDPSAAAFLQVLATGAPRALTIDHVVVDPERDGLLRVLQGAGVDVVREARRDDHGLHTATVTVRGGALAPIVLPVVDVADLVDEVPVLAALCARAIGPCRLMGLHELRVKESDRLGRIADLLRAFGLTVELDDDSLTIQPGPLRAPTAPVVTDHDHRIGMTALVLARLGRPPGETLAVTLDDDDCVAESWPGFPGVVDDVQRRLWTP